MTMYITQVIQYCGQKDEPAMQVIFSSVKKRCPNGEINVLMTDDCKDVGYLIMIKCVVCISHSIV